MKTLLIPLSAAALGMVTLLAPTEARADSLDACGGVFFEALAEGSCEVVPVESCETRCEPVATEKICAVRLYNDCAPECDVSLTTECTAECSSSCTTECECEVEEPSCFDLGMNDCEVECSAGCEASDGSADCYAGCSHTCAANCDGSCRDYEAETDCDTVCEAACSGSCTAKANIDCQVECQQRSVTTCHDQVVQECNEECETEGAAIFCEGQFLATGNNLRACADELLAEFSISIDVDIDVDVDVDVDDAGDGDEDGNIDLDGDDDGDTQIGCSVGDGYWRTSLAFSALFVLGFGATRMRRQRKRHSS
jgi:hypothetical protein